jgi:hypothetical protein
VGEEGPGLCPDSIINEFVGVMEYWNDESFSEIMDLGIDGW